MYSSAMLDICLSIVAISFLLVDIPPFYKKSVYVYTVILLLINSVQGVLEFMPSSPLYIPPPFGATNIPSMLLNIIVNFLAIFAVAYSIGYFLGRLNDQVLATKKSNEELSEEKSKVDAIIDNAGEAILVVDRNDNIIIANNIAGKLFKKGTDKIIRQSIFKIMGGLSWDRLPILYNWKKGKKSETQEKVLKSFEEKTFSIMTSPVFDDRKKPIYGIFLLRDITAQKEVEYAEAKEQFLLLASHELRTPLTKIRWSLENLVKGVFGKLDSKQGEVINIAFQGSNRLSDMLNQIMDTLSITNKEFFFGIEKFDIVKVLNECLDFYKREVEDKKLNLIINTPEQLFINGSSKYLGFVIKNLISNAIRFTEKGNITVNLRTKDKKIIFEIIDTGVGIADSYQPHIFEKFFQVGDVLKRQISEGIGLGLYLSKIIVEKHKGRIWFKSKANKGSTFSFELSINLIKQNEN